MNKKFKAGKKKDKEQEARGVVFEKFFNYSDQKRAVTKAAKESAEDQNTLVEKYNRLVKVGQ